MYFFFVYIIDSHDKTALDYRENVLKYNIIDFPIIEQLIRSEFNIYGLIECIENRPTHQMYIILC